MSVSQKQKSIDSLHEAAKTSLPNVDKILEISSKSRETLGVALSAFNLSFTTLKQQRTLTIESAFQGSKVFQRGVHIPTCSTWLLAKPKGQAFIDLWQTDRIQIFGKEWELEPRTAFYDWLYISALKKYRASRATNWIFSIYWHRVQSWALDKLPSIFCGIICFIIQTRHSWWCHCI